MTAANFNFKTWWHFFCFDSLIWQLFGRHFLAVQISWLRIESKSCHLGHIPGDSCQFFFDILNLSAVKFLLYMIWTSMFTTRFENFVQNYVQYFLFYDISNFKWHIKCDSCQILTLHVCYFHVYNMISEIRSKLRKVLSVLWNQTLKVACQMWQLSNLNFFNQYYRSARIFSRSGLLSDMSCVTPVRFWIFRPIL